jgi:hypothetical protein
MANGGNLQVSNGQITGYYNKNKGGGLSPSM